MYVRVQCARKRRRYRITPLGSRNAVGMSSKNNAPVCFAPSALTSSWVTLIGLYLVGTQRDASALFLSHSLSLEDTRKCFLKITRMQHQLWDNAGITFISFELQQSNNASSFLAIQSSFSIININLSHYLSFSPFFDVPFNLNFW